MGNTINMELYKRYIIESDTITCEQSPLLSLMHKRAAKNESASKVIGQEKSLVRKRVCSPTVSLFAG